MGPKGRTKSELVGVMVMGLFMLAVLLGLGWVHVFG
jgi:hypothetical protein